MAKTLIRPVYQNLLNDISHIYTASQLQARRTINAILTKAYWDIGKRIVIVEQENELRAQYGTGLLERLSNDLTAKYGHGFSVRNIRNMRKYYIEHPIRQPVAVLEWSKELLLLSLKNDRKRSKYRNLAITEGWSRAKLIEMLKLEKLTLSQGSRAIKETVSNADLMRETSNEQLFARKGPLHTYKAAPGDAGYIYVDVGFSITRQIKSWAAIAKGDLIRSRKLPNGFQLEKARALPKDLYTYKAYLDRVIDGDTLRLHIDLGFDTFIKETVRLRGIDAPEKKSSAGQRAKRYVAKSIRQASAIIVKTHYEDKYGRYLIDLWLDDGYLNQRLIDNGLANRY